MEFLKNKFKMNLTLLLFALCDCITEAKLSLTLESARGRIKLICTSHRLKVLPQATLEVAKDVKCTASCMRNEACFSFNVKKKFKLVQTFYQPTLCNFIPSKYRKK
jgi:hypothetical protein